MRVWSGGLARMGGARHPGHPSGERGLPRLLDLRESVLAPTVDIITMLDQSSSDFLFLAENPMHPHSGTLLNTLRNRATKYTTLRLTLRSNRTASRKPASPITSPTQVADVGWHIRRRPLGRRWCRPSPYPRNFPGATRCAVELTFLNGCKAAII